MLDVACHSCPRRGRYRITRLIDRYGSHFELSKLTTLLSSDCSKNAGTSFFDRCGIYIPGWKPQLKAGVTTPNVKNRTLRASDCECGTIRG